MLHPSWHEPLFSWATCIYMATFRCTSTRALGLRLVISSTFRSDGNSVFSRLGLKLNQWFSERPDTLDKRIAARNPCHKDLMKTKTITDLVSTSGMVRIDFARCTGESRCNADRGNQVNTCYRWQLVTWACITWMLSAVSDSTPILLQNPYNYMY